MKNEKPGVKRKRFIDTYVTKIKPASEESRPSNQLNQLQTQPSMDLKPLGTLLEVARVVEGDPIAVSLILDSVNLCAKYVQAVVAHEGARRLDVYTMEPKEFRKHMSNLDESRHAVHNALIAKVAALNRLCNSKGFDPVHTDDINDRANVGDFSLEIVSDIFKLRVK